MGSDGLMHCGLLRDVGACRNRPQGIEASGKAGGSFVNIQDSSTELVTVSQWLGQCE